MVLCAVDNNSKRSDPPFPTRWSLLAAVMLFIIMVVVRPAVFAFSGMKSWVVTFELLIALVAWGLLAGVVLIGQAVAYRLLRPRIRRRSVWAALFLLPAAVLGANSLHETLVRAQVIHHMLLPEVKARRILGHGRLARLPESATEVRVYDWSSLFAGEWFLRFRASPEDIERFLAESPSLRGQECVMFSRARMRLPRSLQPTEHGFSDADPNTYYGPDYLAPKWYNPTIRERGRSYEIPSEDNHNWGEVIVDDADQVVYVKVIWS